MNKNPLGNLKKLSDVAKMVVTKPTVQADRDLALDQIYTTVQVRKKFRNLEELAESIRELGVIEPLVVHEEPDGRYRLIVGERRYRAAPIAGKTEVPVVIKRGLSEEQIRAIQVAENNERDDLTPYEKVMGVIEDVTKFGTKAAMKIWNITSEGWISKRMAVNRYGPITLSILADELSGDLEVLHSINKIEQLDADVAQQLRAQLERGEPLHRDTVRSKLSMMELQKAEAKRVPPPRTEVDYGPEETAGAASGSGGQAPAEPATQAAAAGNAPSAGGAKATVTKLPTKPRTVGVEDADAAAARERTLKGERLYAQRVELFEYGRDNEDSFERLQSLMSELGHSADEGEWAMWVGFLDMVLPMLDRLGDARSKAYMKRLLADMKTSSPAALWQALHPGADLNNISKTGIAVPPMPPGWKF